MPDIIQYLKLAKRKTHSPIANDPVVFLSRETFILELAGKSDIDKLNIVNVVKNKCKGLLAAIPASLMDKFIIQNNITKRSPIAELRSGLITDIVRTDFKIDLYNHLHGLDIINDITTIDITDDQVTAATVMELVEVWEILVRISICQLLSQRLDIPLHVVFALFRSEGNLSIPHEFILDQNEIPSIFAFSGDPNYKVATFAKIGIPYDISRNMVVLKNNLGLDALKIKCKELWFITLTGLDYIFSKEEVFYLLMQKILTNSGLFTQAEQEQLMEKLDQLDIGTRNFRTNIVLLPVNVQDFVQVFLEIQMAHFWSLRNKVIIQHNVAAGNFGTKSIFSLHTDLTEGITYLNYHATGYFSAIIVDALLNAKQKPEPNALKNLISLDEIIFTAVMVPFTSVLTKPTKKMKIKVIENNLGAFQTVIDWLNGDSNRILALCEYIENTSGTKWHYDQQHRANLSRFLITNDFYKSKLI